MQQFLTELLECPACHGALDWRIESSVSDQIEQGEAICDLCEAIYPIRDGIGIFLTADLPREDLWDQVETSLTAALRNDPEVYSRLMDSPFEDLSPTDQKFRAMALEESGDFEAARQADQDSNFNLYTPEYMACWTSQIDFVLDRLSQTDGPVVDLASGRAYLAEKIIAGSDRPVVVTDFSLQVLRRNRKYFDYLGIYLKASLLAFDARRTPFKDASIEVMTSNLGLPNIHESEALPSELARIVDGELLAISHFYPPHDLPNQDLINAAGLKRMLNQESAVRSFEAAGWHITLENLCSSRALPTPGSTILEGARADGLPAAPTELRWAVVHGKTDPPESGQ
ncbi:MAG: Trm112 family protein [Anaerolineales bacterium]|nr:Trm112 family protein [Anaerolineales bacterium]